MVEGHIASEISLDEAIVWGVLPTPKHVTTVFQYKNEQEKYQLQIRTMRLAALRDESQKYLNVLRQTLEQAIIKQFQAVKWVLKCRVLFETLRNSLSGIWEQYFAAVKKYAVEYGKAICKNQLKSARENGFEYVKVDGEEFGNLLVPARP